MVENLFTIHSLFCLNTQHIHLSLTKAKANYVL